MIRRLSPDDWKVFRELRLEMLREEPLNFGSTYEDWVEKPERDIRDWLTMIHLLGLFDDGVLVGTGGLVRHKGVRAAHRGTLLAIYVKPSHRGQGKSTRLLSALMETARGLDIDLLDLQVLASNEAAKSTYLKAGFHIAATIPRALRINGVDYDDHMMICDLKSSVGEAHARNR